MTPTDKADQLAADLVATCYGKLGALAIVVRAEGNEVRLICPAENYKAVALMLYRAADEMAARAPAPKIG